MNEDDALSFLAYYADADANPGMRVKTRELVSRPITAGPTETVESDYQLRRGAAETRRAGRPSSRLPDTP
jgi:hypothetical protein